MYLFASSMKNTPGSPVRHAPSTILSHTSAASSWPVTAFVVGSTRSYEPPARSASMNLRVTPTEMLKFVICVRSSLQVMNSITSGWSTRRIPMFAPRRVPPCFTASVLAS